MAKPISRFLFSHVLPCPFAPPQGGHSRSRAGKGAQLLRCRFLAVIFAWSAGSVECSSVKRNKVFLRPASFLKIKKTRVIFHACFLFTKRTQ